MPPRDWDAATYERIAAPMTAMGSDVLDRLVLRGDETVLDAGLRHRQRHPVLLERLPRGHVIAVDASPSMVAEARALLPGGVDVREADLLELELDAPVDAILSTATFHWIPDHDRLFAQPARGAEARRAARRAVRRRRQRRRGQGGRARRSRPIRRTPSTSAAGIPTGRSRRPRTTERRLRAAGFTDVWCWLTRVDVDPDDPVAYLRAICLGSFLARLPDELHEPFVDAALARLQDPLRIHYVRLNILAAPGT